MKTAERFFRNREQQRRSSSAEVDGYFTIIVEVIPSRVVVKPRFYRWMPTQECFRTCLQHLGEFLKFLFGDGCRARLPTLVVGLGYSHFLCKLRLGQARTNPELLELRFHALPLVDLYV